MSKSNSHYVFQKKHYLLKFLIILVFFPTLTVGCASGGRVATLGEEIDELKKRNEDLLRQKSELARSVQQASSNVTRLSLQVESARAEAAKNRNQYREDLSNRNNDINACGGKLEICREKLVKLENSKVGQVLQRLKECKASVPEARAEGWQRGRSELLETIQISGMTEVEWGFPWKEYYYVFEINVDDKKFFVDKVRICGDENPLIQVLSGVAGLAPFILKKRLKF